jgi:hypothetical protein
MVKNTVLGYREYSNSVDYNGLGSSTLKQFQQSLEVLESISSKMFNESLKTKRTLWENLQL